MTRLRIIVGGLVGQFPLGGVAWDYFHYVLGLAELGHDVYYHEDTWVWPFDPIKRYPTNDPDYTARFIGDFFRQYTPHLADRWHYVLLHEKHFGMTANAFDEVAKTADIFLNVSGACFTPDNLSPRCVKVFLDTDPGYNQIMLHEKFAWSENVERWCKQVAAHDRHLTYAENIHNPDCIMPRMDFDWRPTRCVVTLPQWSQIRDNSPPESAPFTTVMTWDYFRGKLIYNGVDYRTKVPEFEKFEELPSKVSLPLALAIGGVLAPVDHVRAKGWQTLDAHVATLTPQSYQQLIRDSAGEWSVAKNVYVATNSGWFSCRTACYLAAGRPAVVQETGWSRFIPTGRGLFAFSTIEQAIDGLKTVVADPLPHRAAAYEIARDYLAPDKVLPPHDRRDLFTLMKKLTIVVGGYIVAYPLGGMTWHHLNYLLGLHALGHEVYFLEDSGSYSYPYNPVAQTMGADSSYGRAYLERTFAEYGLPLRYCYYSEFEDAYYGMSQTDLANLLRRADLLLCVSGVTPLRPDRPRPRRTAVIDTDPVFTQLRMTHDADFLAYYNQFDSVATFGRLIGTPACPLPTHGIDWIPTNQPIALDHWPVQPTTSLAFTTIGKWEHSADRNLEFQGRRFHSSKGVEWLKLIDLPSRVPWEMTLGMLAMPQDIAHRFSTAGWRIVDAQTATLSCRSFADFIRNSAGEFTVAKEIYAGLPSGWFSDRGAAYLASGRPVVMQATGFDQWLPTGEGLFSFSNLDEVAAALNKITDDYPGHAIAARAIAEEHFDSKKVLSYLLDRVTPS